MIARRAARALAALTIACTAATAFAQAPAPAPAPAAAPAEMGPPAPPAPPAGPAAIPVGEVASRIDATYRDLNALRAVAEPDPLIVEIEKQATGEEAMFHEQVLEAARLLSGDVSLDQLEEIQARASTGERQLAAWQKALAERSQQLEKNRNAVAQLRETWSLTLDGARKESAPPELIENIKGVRAEIRAVQKALDERFELVLKTQGLVAEESLAVSVLSQDIRRARFEVRGRIFERNRLSLPGAIAAVEDVAPVLDRVRDGIERDWKSIRTFASLEGGQQIVIHVLVFLGLLFGAVRLKHWSRVRRRGGKSLGAGEEVLDHPVSTAILFAVLATPWIHPFLPRSYLSALGLVVVIPILVLLPNVLAPRFRTLWYVLAAIFVLGRVRGVFQSVELIERSIFLVETTASAGVAFWLLRRERFAELVAGRWIGVMRIALRIAFGALVVAAIANVLGFVSLAKVLGGGTLSAALSATALYAGVNVARPLFAALLRTAPAKTLRVVQARRDQVERRFGQLLVLLSAVWWALRTLDGFAIGDPMRERMRALLTEPLPLGAVGFSLGDVLLFLVTAAAGVVIARLVQALLEEDVFPRTRMARGVPHAISATVRYAILLAGFLLAAAAAGFDWSRLTLLAGAFGVGIGFGLQNIVNNFISGLILLYERPIQIGDTIEVGALVGEVKRIGIRSSSVRTWQGSEVIVPNGNLIAEQVVNWTLSDRTRRIEIPVGCAYDADPERVIEVLEEVGRSHPDVMAEPPALAVLVGFGDSAINFELRVWTANFDRLARVRSDVGLAVHRALRAAGIGIPFPQRDVRVVLADERDGKGA